MPTITEHHELTNELSIVCNRGQCDMCISGCCCACHGTGDVSSSPIMAEKCEVCNGTGLHPARCGYVYGMNDLEANSPEIPDSSPVPTKGWYRGSTCQNVNKRNQRPQYQIHLLPGGLWCGVVTPDGKAVTIAEGVGSLKSAMRRCDKHAKVKLNFEPCNGHLTAFSGDL